MHGSVWTIPAFTELVLTCVFAPCHACMQTAALVTVAFSVGPKARSFQIALACVPPACCMQGAHCPVPHAQPGLGACFTLLVPLRLQGRHTMAKVYRHPACSLSSAVILGGPSTAAASIPAPSSSKDQPVASPRPPPGHGARCPGLCVVACACGTSPWLSPQCRAAPLVSAQPLAVPGSTE